MESSRENSFWKTNGRLVPGRPSPKKENKLMAKSAKGPIGSTSFQDFQNSVRDAWDIGDDEFCIVSEMSSKCKFSSNKNICVCNYKKKKKKMKTKCDSVIIYWCNKNE